MQVAHVVVDVPAHEIDSHFDYLVPEGMDGVGVGCCVLVDFGRRPCIGYVVGLAGETEFKGKLSYVRSLLGGPYFGVEATRVVRWIAGEYLCPLSEALRLFTPPGGTPRAVKEVVENGTHTWVLKHPAAGPVDDRWAMLVAGGGGHTPRANATQQRAVLDALASGPVRVAELAADLGSVDGALRSLARLGAVVIERRQRIRGAGLGVGYAPRHAVLTAGQIEALAVIAQRRTNGGGVVLLDGVTGSGKTEVYLRAIEEVLAEGLSACVLVPEISLTPQTVGRFRSRFGDSVAVLHSRLSPGERFDQWSLVRDGDARVVVGARSALFAPFSRLGIVIIDEEHEPSYKQGSSPRYHAREVAEQLCAEHGATLVLGSASPSMESLERCSAGAWTRVEIPVRATGRPLPPVEIVDLAAEFAAGHRSMFSRPLTEALGHVRASGEKAILFLNRRGFASFLLCRECGFVPTCDSCTTSMTFHEVGSRLACHHCGATRAVPPTCPSCGSPYLRQFGAGTQRVEAELLALMPDWPIVRMDADTTKGKGGHERQLARFEALESGVLLGTQMIAKGLDYPEVTLVGVITADVTLNVPDFRAGERTYQLLEQVAGRAGRGERGGRVVIQTYWPEHPALHAAALHDSTAFYEEESRVRAELGYPPFGRLANIVVRGRDAEAVETHAAHVVKAVRDVVPDGWSVLGPSAAPLSRVKGVWRWHVLVKAPAHAQLPLTLRPALAGLTSVPGVAVVVDVDPVDLL